jgi:predicted enzyme related to lactoylglutathione lyase
MSIDNALANVAVKDLDKAAAWYAKLLGSEGHRPMAEVAESMFPRGGGLQVYAGPERAGHCSFTLVVSNIDEQVRKLESMGVDTSQRSTSDRVKTLMVSDPDGNSIAFAQAMDPTLAR